MICDRSKSFQDMYEELIVFHFRFPLDIFPSRHSRVASIQLILDVTRFFEQRTFIWREPIRASRPVKHDIFRHLSHKGKRLSRVGRGRMVSKFVSRPKPIVDRGQKRKWRETARTLTGSGRGAPVFTGNVLENHNDEAKKKKYMSLFHIAILPLQLLIIYE